MRTFKNDDIEKILSNRMDTQTLISLYPELKENVAADFKEIAESNDTTRGAALIAAYKARAQAAIKRIQKTNKNQKAIETFLPDIIKARIAMHLLEQMTLVARSGKSSGKIRLNRWDGMLLQRTLFKNDLERKPVSLPRFYFFWFFVTNKKILMLLLNKKGIYCFYSKPILRELARLIGETKCVEIGAGDGTLTRFLKERGVDCIATDNYSWDSYITYPDFVEKLDAKEALRKYRPETVICSWPPSGNKFEKLVFKADSVICYIVIGSSDPAVAGDHIAYGEQEGFAVESNPRLASLMLPPSNEHAVYIFRRIGRAAREDRTPSLMLT